MAGHGGPVREAPDQEAGGPASRAAGAGGVQVRLLGPVDITVDGVPRPLRGPRRAAVLAILALRHRDVVSADSLIDAVWGESPPPTALNTLQRHISHLRQALGD